MSTSYSDIRPRRSSSTMMSRMRQATATIKSSTSSHSHLAMVIYQDKCMREALHKLGSAKLNLSKAIMDWIKLEQNPYTKELALQMAEMDRMWIRAHDEYNEQYSAHRNTFKEIMKGAKLIDEKVRKTDAQHKKVNKLQKQIESAQKKQDSIKQAVLETDHDHETNLYREATADLEYYRDQHEKFKFLKFQEAYQVQCDSGNVLQSKCERISTAREMMLSACPKTVRAAGEAESLASLQARGQQVLNDLANILDISRPHADSEGFRPPQVCEPKRASSYEGSLSDVCDEEPVYAEYSTYVTDDTNLRSLQEAPLGEPTSPHQDARFSYMSASELSPPTTPDDEFDDDPPVYGNIGDYEGIYDTADNLRSPSIVRPPRLKNPPPPRPAYTVHQSPEEVPVNEDRRYPEEDLYANQSIRLRKSQKNAIFSDPSAESTPL